MALQKRIVRLLDEEVVINPNDLLFDDRTLNQFFERVSGRIDYIGRCHADAQHISLRREQEYEQMWLGLYKRYRLGESKCAEKTSELLAKGDDAVQKAKQEYIEAKHTRDLLYAHLQALNAAREDAHNRGHFIRKEMDKLHSDIMLTPEQQSRRVEVPTATEDDINSVTGEI